MHIVLSDGFKEKLKRGDVSSCTDASDQLDVALLDGLGQLPPDLGRGVHLGDGGESQVHGARAGTLDCFGSLFTEVSHCTVDKSTKGLRFKVVCFAHFGLQQLGVAG